MDRPGSVRLLFVNVIFFQNLSFQTINFRSFLKKIKEKKKKNSKNKPEKREKDWKFAKFSLQLENTARERSIIYGLSSICLNSLPESFQRKTWNWFLFFFERIFSLSLSRLNLNVTKQNDVWAQFIFKFRKLFFQSAGCFLLNSFILFVYVLSITHNRNWVQNRIRLRMKWNPNNGWFV